MIDDVRDTIRRLLATVREKIAPQTTLPKTAPQINFYFHTELSTRLTIAKENRSMFQYYSASITVSASVKFFFPFN